ncbi:MAG TPA: biotin--[acetyl-CoA-carboxylase] ligase [bacterium]|nr:biotin--[acetyl-CoA-carboxylase] ligase [bacterium]
MKKAGTRVSFRSSRIIGRKIFRYVRITSTQDKAKKFAQKGLAEGTVVIAEIQTQGKGRLGRRWVSPKGGIWLSVILRPEITPMEVPKTTMIGSLAVAKAIAELTRIEVKLKWPNDVLIRHIPGIEFKKVCGVLTEMVSGVSQVNYVITGLGINVNNRIPPPLRANATSLKDVIGRNLPKQKLLRKVLENFDKYYWNFKRQGMGPILKECKRMSAVLDKEVKIECADGIIEGKALDIDEYGALIVETEDGRKRVVAGDVTILSKM